MVNWNVFSSQGRNAAITNRVIEIPRNHIDLTSPDVTLERAGSGYHRIILKSMFLPVDKPFFGERFPAVAYEVKFTFGSQSRTLAGVVSPASILEAGKSAGNTILIQNKALTPLVPFNGGEIEIKLALLSMKGDDILRSFLQAMEGISGAAVSDYLSTVVSTASKVYDGLQTLFGLDRDEMVLGYYTTVLTSGADPLRPQHIALVDSQESISPDDLYVSHNRVQFHDGVMGQRDYTKSNHLLFEIQTRTQRNDALSIGNVRASLGSAAEYQIIGKADMAAKFLEKAKIELIQTHDLCDDQRAPAIAELNAKFNELTALYSTPSIITTTDSGTSTLALDGKVGEILAPLEPAAEDSSQQDFDFIDPAQTAAVEALLEAYSPRVS